MLNVAITGNSDGASGLDLPYGDGKAAIMIISKETLKLGSGAVLTANGTYGMSGTVDDRPGIDFSDHDIPADNKLGDWPIDIAIYLASNAGNVSVGSTVNAIPTEGTMVIDAYDTVDSFGANFLNSLIAGNVCWLEVCSRITPALDYAQTNHTLPYADDPDLFPGTGRYSTERARCGSSRYRWKLYCCSGPGS